MFSKVELALRNMSSRNNNNNNDNFNNNNHPDVLDRMAKKQKADDEIFLANYNAADDDIVFCASKSKADLDSVVIDADSVDDDDIDISAFYSNASSDEEDEQPVKVKNEKPDAVDFDASPAVYYDPKKYAFLPEIDFQRDHDVHWPVESGLMRLDSDTYEAFIQRSASDPAFLQQRTRDLDDELNRLFKRWVEDMRPQNVQEICAMFGIEFTHLALSNETEDTIRESIRLAVKPLHDLSRCLGFVYGSIYQTKQHEIPVNFSASLHGSSATSTPPRPTDGEQSGDEGQRKKRAPKKSAPKHVNPTRLYGRDVIKDFTLPSDPNFGMKVLRITERMTRVLRAFNNCARLLMHLHDLNHVVYDDSIEDASAFQIINSINNIHCSFLVSGVMSVILDRMLKILRENRIHRQGKDLYEPVFALHRGKKYFVHSFRPFMTVEQFVVNVLTNSEFRYSLDEYVPRYCKSHFGRISTTIREYLEKSEDSAIPKMSPVRGVYSFTNGLYFAYRLEFHEWLDVERTYPDVTSYMYVETEFDVSLLTCPLFAGTELAVPYVDDILNNQPLDDLVKQYFWFLYGRLLFPLDGLQLSLMLHGVPNSGKTMMLRFLELLVPSQRIAPISDVGQMVFGLEDLADKHLVLALDIGKNFLRHNCVFNDRSFNCFVSGESLSISRKNQLSVMKPIDAMFAGAFNLPPVFNSGNLRRIVTFYFSCQLQNDNPNIFNVFARDKPAIMRMLVKMTRSYLLYRNHVYANCSFLQKHPEYFTKTNEDLNELQDPATNFIREHVRSSVPSFRLYHDKTHFLERVRRARWEQCGNDVFAYFGTVPHISYELFLQLYSAWFAQNKIQYGNTRGGEWKNEVVLRQSLTRSEFRAEPSHLEPQAFLTLLIKKHNAELFDAMYNSNRYTRVCQLVQNAGFVTAADRKRKKTATNELVDIKIRNIYWFVGRK